MGVIGIIGLIFSIITKMPSLISTGFALLKLLPKFKGASFAEDLVLIGDILRIIVGVIPQDKEKASEVFTLLKDHLATATPNLAELKTHIQNRCEGIGCAPQLVHE